MTNVTNYQQATPLAPLSTTMGTLSLHRTYFGVSSYVCFNSDGTLSSVHVQNVVDANGVSVPMITDWAQISGIDTVIQAASPMPFAQLKAMLDAGTATGANVMGYLMSGNDVITGSAGAETIQGMGGNDSIHGNGGADYLQGGAGADRLWGDAGGDKLWGGVGADILTGGAGADVFQFKAISEGGDHITDFTHGSDHFLLIAAAFGHAQFVNGSAAGTISATLLYNATSGVLSFDADGKGAGAAVVLATLDNHAHLTAADFLFV